MMKSVFQGAIMEKAPAFNLHDQNGKQHSLTDFKGKYLVLYFYPKDDTPGCTKEACDFRDQIGNLREMGAEVLGVSADDTSSHEKFAGKHGLNFPLLADDGAVIAKAYGAYGQKNMYGKISEGIMRKTFLIDPNGEIIKAWGKVSVEGHVEQVTAALKAALA
jgi:thioredoxin-dependent peroxiredoxin